MLAVALVAGWTAGCSDDADVDGVDNSGQGEVAASHVVVAQPQSRAYFEKRLDGTFEFNDEGLLTSIKGEDGRPEVTYEYLPGTKAGESLVRMVVYEGTGPNDVTVCDLNIGRNGFANSGLILYAPDGSVDYMHMTYDADGHLVRVNYGGDECVMKYDANGNLVRMTDYANGEDEYQISYDNTKPNNIGYMIYFWSLTGFSGNTYREVAYAYYAGLVGVPSANLPSAAHVDYHGRYSDSDYLVEYEYDDTGTLTDLNFGEVY